jgi:hypothetical protein
MKKSKQLHELNDREFAELKAGAEEALAYAQAAILIMTLANPRRVRAPGLHPHKTAPL